MDRLVTKTLAEIYLQQGHIEEAYSLFKTLSERDPEDVDLKNRLEELEEKMSHLAPAYRSGRPEAKFPGNVDRITRSDPPPANLDGAGREHSVGLPTDLSRPTQSTLPAPKRIQNLEKWLNNIRERRKL